MISYHEALECLPGLGNFLGLTTLKDHAGARLVLPLEKRGEGYRIFLRAMTCIVLFAATPAMAQDCLALGRACVAQCLGGAGSTANLNPNTRSTGPGKGLHQPM
jgi:hypothetical protein